LLFRNLEDYLDTRSEVDLPKNTQIFTEIMLGVKSIHQAGIIHRDLKPANILLDSNGHISITDFGMGKVPLVACKLWYCNSASSVYLTTSIFSQDNSQWYFSSKFPRSSNLWNTVLC
jgi:serine/threonine protein kinase